ncbi:hypothetical protein ACLB2K_069380 [Fragaria x ananassa]
MLGHCAGLPLAIIVLAGLLSKKDTVNEWETVCENVNVYIRRGTDLDREYKGQQYGDYEIPVKRLTHLWMAEGFISETSSELLEDVSYSCLCELVQRCIVQVGEIGSTGKIKSCRLHDLMRDLCMLKAKEEHFSHVVNFSTGTRTNATQVGRVRRLAIYVDTYGDNCDNLVPTTRDGHLRSLLYFGSSYYVRFGNKRLIRSIFNDFKLLRVLKLEGMKGLKKLPSTIGNLVHLRFLSLKDSAADHLPSSAANLVCLQTLDLRCFLSYPIKMKISDVFRKMEQLRHLYLPIEYTVDGKLTWGNLQTLVNVECEGLDLNALVGSNVRKLNIRGFSKYRELEEILKSSSGPTFHHLRSLSLGMYGHNCDILLRFRLICKLQLTGGIKELPEGLLSFPNLIKITLSCTNLSEYEIEILEKLPHLRVLHLRGSVFDSLPSDTLVCTNGGFPNLESLSIRRLPELKEWRLGKGAMPRLRRLCINYCEELKAVPDGLQYIQTLKELTVRWMPSEFCSRLGKEGEDFDKIKHVPSLIITGTHLRDESDSRKYSEATQAFRNGHGTKI